MVELMLVTIRKNVAGIAGVSATAKIGAFASNQCPPGHFGKLDISNDQL
jgi:hypothetical protein